ncbi:uncharacterized protein LOC133900755 [Phragmites australis]|uniref:uncharacterized protein LOC133900755 n=1 Tax=Phragmites australis TaxID=29695 RepID=UPI002D7743EB|nr:uncharacterized protein LOC133900755 [Phragmites australis]
MSCPPMDASAAKNQGKGKKMSRGAGKKPSQSSWMVMGFYPSSSDKNRTQSAAAAAAEGKNGSTHKSSGGGGGKKKKRIIGISRSMTCAGSICSTKESSVTSRGGATARSASGRSLKAPDDTASAAAISATSSFNSETTAATTVSSSSPLSSALSSPLSSFGGSFRAVQIRKLSGCYECHSVFDPKSLGTAAFPCAGCDEVFVKAESLELHRATMHAVSELGPNDTSRNIVEIIFQSSWLRKQGPVCKIERILKVQSSDQTVKRFEQYKESIKEMASNDEGKKNPRCVADGNELLRFHCTTFTCALGAAGGTALCRAPSTRCKLCGIIRDGFRFDGDGKIATMATSGRAHDMAQVSPDGEKRAMLVCRVVAGRVKKATDTSSSEDCDCDSVSPCSEGVYSDLDELFVFNPRAILPCFVVIYSGY